MSSLPAASDTPPEVIAVRDALLRAQTSVQKAQRVRDASRAVDLLAREGFRMRCHGITDDELRYRMAELRLGSELAAQVYGMPNDRI